MVQESFFKSTPLYKEYLLLSTISSNSKSTQRQMASNMDVSLTMVNFYLDEYEKKGLIHRRYNSKKEIDYFITKEGEERRKILNFKYLESALQVFNKAKKECINIVNNILDKGFKNVLFYGAGEVAEMLLTVIKNEDSQVINVCGIIDDDKNKIGKNLLSIPIININDINNIDYDAILISCYSDSDNIYNKLISNKISDKKIIKFFEGDR